MSKEHKIAIIGIGHWGKNLLAELEKQVEVKYKCDNKTDLNVVFSDPEIEAVFVATPTKTHFEVAKKVITAGKHLFLEKPGTSSSSELAEIVEMARAKNLVFAVGYEFPHHPAIQKIKELIAGHQIIGMAFEWNKWGTFENDAVPHLLSHDISVAKYLGLQNITPVFHHRTKVISESDITITKFLGENNEEIVSYINRTSGTAEKSATIITDKDIFIISGNKLFKVNQENRELEQIEIDTTSPVANEIKDFLTALENEKTPKMNGDFALAVYKTIESVKI